MNTCLVSTVVTKLPSHDNMEAIKENFPHPHIPAQPGMPTHDIIAAVHRKLKANAASVESTLGGGTHGLLGLTILPETYQTVTGYPFVAPLKRKLVKQFVNIRRDSKSGKNTTLQI